MKYSKEVKEKVINEYIINNVKPRVIVEEYGISRSLLYQWLRPYRINESTAIDITDQYYETINEPANYIEFKLNGYDIKLESKYLNVFLKGLNND